MTNLKLKYVHRFKDRHGKVRHYFRRSDIGRIPLPGLPGSEEFMKAYNAALQGKKITQKKRSEHVKPDTLNALVVSYFNSPDFKNLAPSTRTTYRGIIENFRKQHGEKRVDRLNREHIDKMRDAKSDTPAAANNWLRMVRLLMSFAIDYGFRSDDPTAGVKRIKTRSEGFYTWSEADIRTFEEYHPIGTKARLAMALLLYTAQRRGDVVTIGHQHIKTGVLRIKQQKTGALVEIPIHPELQSIVDKSSSEHLTILTTEYGRPFSPAGFTNWFRDRCREAGIPNGCTPHGLGKAAARRLAEAGCSPHEIMAFTGHKTLKEVSRYTEAADRKLLGKKAHEKIMRTSSGKPYK